LFRNHRVTNRLLLYHMDCVLQPAPEGSRPASAVVEQFII